MNNSKTRHSVNPCHVICRLIHRLRVDKSTKTDPSGSTALPVFFYSKLKLFHTLVLLSFQQQFFSSLNHYTLYLGDKNNRIQNIVLLYLIWNLFCENTALEIIDGVSLFYRSCHFLIVQQDVLDFFAGTCKPERFIVMSCL